MRQRSQTKKWTVAVTALATICMVSRTWAVTPPAGFEDHVVVDPSASTGASSPVGIDYEPGSGALFILEKGDGTGKGNARVRRRDPVTGTVSTALTLTCVGSTGEQGLLGIAFDPDYLVSGGANRYVYLFYTRAVGQSGTSCEIAGVPWGWYNWVVRYQESGGQLINPQVLLRGTLLVANNHDGGTVRFGLDKTLYISMGDNATSSDPVPAARNLNDLRGKILRINRDGTIPADNPFVGQSGVRPEIWAYGLRNPFRMSVDSVAGTLLIGDVGESNWEEIDTGVRGADYGWPCLEASTPFRACSPPPSGDIKPSYAYGHNGQTPPVEGNSVIGGPVYRGASFPPEYVGQYFFGDYGGNWIRRATIAANGTLTAVTMFVPDATTVVDMAVSPAGCLTWVSIGGLGVHDICQVGGNNAQPQAVSTAAPMSGLAPLTVQFDGTASTDADQDPLTYSWAFGDSTTSAAAAPLKTYSTIGVRQAVLTVNDGSGTSNATDAAPPLRIVVGNRSPSGSITSPAAGAHYSAGDTIAYSASATDPEDGTLPASAYSWLIVFHHSNHTHPFLGPIVGVKSGTFVIPTTGEDSTDVFFRIELTVTDSGAPLGSTGTISQVSHVDIVPNVTTVTVAASPAGAGIQLAIDQTPGIAPWSKSTVANFPRVLTAITPQTVRGATWAFVSWSDGGAPEHAVSPPIVPTTYTATYQCTAGCEFTPAISAARIAPDTARVQWAPLACALSYDVVRGSVGMLRSTLGDYVPSTFVCVANDTALTTLDDPTATPAGGFWYLVRGNGCGGVGNYDEGGVGSQFGVRSAEIAASGKACP
jgi:glucose/arabinose dehydrogenase